MSFLLTAGFFAAASAWPQTAYIETCEPRKEEVIVCLLDKDGRRPKPFDPCFYGKKVVGLGVVVEQRLYWNESPDEPVNLRETHVKGVYPVVEAKRTISECRVKNGMLPYLNEKNRSDGRPAGTGYIQPETVVDRTPATGRETAYEGAASNVNTGPSRGSTPSFSCAPETPSPSSGSEAADTAIATPAQLPAPESQSSSVSGSER